MECRPETSAQVLLQIQVAVGDQFLFIFSDAGQSLHASCLNAGEETSELALLQTQDVTSESKGQSYSRTADALQSPR